MPKSVVSYYPEEIGFPDKSCLIKVLAVLFYLSPFFDLNILLKKTYVFLVDVAIFRIGLVLCQERKRSTLS